MAVYNKDGSQVSEIYSKSGISLSNAYDIEGNLLPLGSTGIKVMSYNVMRWEGLNNRKAIQDIAFISDDVDIIGVQEWGYTSSGGNVGGVNVLSYLPACGYDYIEVGTDIYNKNSLVSKLPLMDVSETVFSSNSESYQRCRFVKDGKTITWINTHLATSSNESRKVAQAGAIFTAAENEDYVIITGDFNTVCKSVEDEEYTTIMKQFVDAGYNCANCTAQFGFLDTWTDGTSLESAWYPCDHIITSGNIDIISVTRDMTKVEAATGLEIDHIPLIAYLSIN